MTLLTLYQPKFKILVIFCNELKLDKIKLLNKMLRKTVGCGSHNKRLLTSPQPITFTFLLQIYWPACELELQHLKHWYIVIVQEGEIC